MQSAIEIRENSLPGSSHSISLEIPKSVATHQSLKCGPDLFYTSEANTTRDLCPASSAEVVPAAQQSTIDDGSADSGINSGRVSTDSAGRHRSTVSLWVQTTEMRYICRELRGQGG